MPNWGEPIGMEGNWESTTHPGLTIKVICEKDITLENAYNLIFILWDSVNKEN